MILFSQRDVEPRDLYVHSKDRMIQTESHKQSCWCGVRGKCQSSEKPPTHVERDADMEQKAFCGLFCGPRDQEAPSNPGTTKTADRQLTGTQCWNAATSDV